MTSGDEDDEQEHNAATYYNIPSHNQNCILCWETPTSSISNWIMDSDLAGRRSNDFHKTCGHMPLNAVASFQRDEVVLITVLHSIFNRMRLGTELSKSKVAVATDDDNDSSSSASFDGLGTDDLTNIFGFLSPEDIMRARLNKKMREAAKQTIVPMAEFVVDSMSTYDAMSAMTTALPCLQQISICYLREERLEYSDGEEPPCQRRNARTAELTTHDIEILSSFKLLKSLDFCCRSLNGSYPFIFNFPLLNRLNITGCCHLKWDLEMLSGLPHLKELYCDGNVCLTGNIDSLRVFRDTLVMVDVADCPRVGGGLMDLADFPHLRCLDLSNTSVTGDIRHMDEQSFPTLELLLLSSGVYGGTGYEFQHISDAHDVVMAVYHIHKQRPSLLKDWYGKLSKDSLDWYDGEADDVGVDTVPLYVVFVEAGSRVGYRWESANYDPHPCEVIWLDPEPDVDSSEYEEYIEELHEIERQVVYRGYSQPPTEEQYTRHRLLAAVYQD